MFRSTIDFKDMARNKSQQELTTPSGHVFGAVNASGQSNVHMGDVINVFGTLSTEQTSTSAKDELRRALYYDKMEDRRAQLAGHRTMSFQRIWTDTSFPIWLTDPDRGIYWIRGKPGSGKVL